MRWPKLAAIVSKDTSRGEALLVKATNRLKQERQWPLRFQVSVRSGSASDIHEEPFCWLTDGRGGTPARRSARPPPPSPKTPLLIL